MSDNYQILSVEKPEWGIIGGGIGQYNAKFAGDDSAKSLCVVLRGADEEVVGGIIGATYWDWFNIDLMWIREDLRGQGYGSRLLAFAEEEAQSRGASKAHLDTFDFQAPDFYKKFGYEVFGVLEDCPPGHKRYYMTKKLG